MLQDTDRFSARNAAVPVSTVHPDARAILDDGGFSPEVTIASIDKPRHTRQRTAFNPQLNLRVARQLEMQFLTRTAARLEEERYRRLRRESIINQEVYEDLQRKLRPRRRAVEVRPALDLGLKREDLVCRVPMFAALDAKSQHSVARLLRPRLAVPDEVIVHKGELITPAASQGALKGVTRSTILDIAKELNVPLREADMTRYDVWTADECFLTGTAAEVIPVVKVDSRKIGTGVPGPLTRDLIERFRKLTRS